jgi:metal-dependent amidase/aminoacylase/carboxypeptidase family protein
MLTLEKLIQLRHDLHTHPELSGQEQQTAKRVTAYLQALEPDELLTNIGGHGLVATFDSGPPGPALLLGSELDALPSEESNIFLHRSSRQGISHKCGHDGHSTILCGVTKFLSSKDQQEEKCISSFNPPKKRVKVLKLC